MKKPTQFMAQITVRYSDDSGQALERSFSVSGDDTYQDYMDQMSKIYEQIRYTFGAVEFDKLSVKTEEPVIKEVKDEPDKHTEAVAGACSESTPV